MKTHTQAIKKMSSIKDQQELSTFISQNYGGLDNRFIRQDIIEELTGTKIPLVKCGVSHLAEHIIQHQSKLKRYQEIHDLVVGTPVLRKKCGRKGVIKESVDGKLTIELEDGSIRKPAAQRAIKLYTIQNA